MKIHEYQAKQILAKFGVTVPRGEMITKPEDARAVAEKLGGGTVVVKAQIHAGGRGKGGGVKLAHNPAEAETPGGPDPGHDAGHPPDGARGPRGEARAD